MPTFVYSPGVRIFIATRRHGTLEVTGDLTRGELLRVENQPSRIDFSMKNPLRKYDGVFTPNDRISVRMKRVRWLQQFTGYLNEVPYFSAYGREVSLSATCSLKSLQYRLWDSGLPESWALLNENTSPTGTAEEMDGGMKTKAIRLLSEVGGWPQDRIHIGALPGAWLERIAGLYEAASTDIETAGFGRFLGGPASIGGAPVTTGVGDYGFIVQAASAAGFTGENLVTAVAVAIAESSGDPNAVGTNSPGNGRDHGLWQINDKSHNFDFTRIYDPVYNAQLAYQIWQDRESRNPGRGWTAWYAHTPRGAAYGSGRRFQDALPVAQAAVGGNSPMIGVIPGQGNVTTGSTLSTAGVGTNIGGFTYVFPVVGVDYTNYVSSWGKARSGGRTHKGQDIMAPLGTPAVACTSGVIMEASNIGGGPGLTVDILGDDGVYYRYFHNQTNTVTEGQRVVAGQQVATVGSSGNASPGAEHVHFEVHPSGGRGTEHAVDPHGFLRQWAGIDAPIAGGGLGQAGGFLNLYLWHGQPDPASVILSGPRALMNDEPLLDTVTTLINASQRVYASAPNGDFIAWFPDYFGLYGTAAKMTIPDIELQDFTMQWSDERMKTHQFVVGAANGFNPSNNPLAGGPINIVQQFTTMGIASVEFPQIMQALFNVRGGDDSGWADTQEILARFGPRVAYSNMGVISGPQAEFWWALHLFQQNWANQFSAHVPLTFMPELYPGMLLQLSKHGFQAYIRQVTHTFDFTAGAGFRTTATIVAPSATNGSGLYGLPIARPVTRPQPESAPAPATPVAPGI